MIPPAFDDHAPKSSSEAIALRGSLGSDAKLLAGVDSLLPMMKLRVAQPAHLIGLNRIERAARPAGCPGASGNS